MFGFLRKIFKEETGKKEKEIVKILDIEGWFDKKSLEFYNDLSNKIRQIKHKFDDETRKTRENIETLKNAELQNKNIPERALHFMEGNRGAYIKKTLLFINSIKMPEDEEKIKDFCVFLDKEINNFGKITIKPYAVLQEFFANESRDIALNIKKFDILSRELKGLLHGEKNIRIKAIKENINNINKKIKQKETIKQNIENKKKHYSELKNKKEDFEKELSHAKNSKEFHEFKNSEEEKSNIELKLKEHKNILYRNFSVLEKSLRKFSRMILEDEKLVNDYAADAVNALNNDKNLKIIEILKKMLKNIEENKIDLKDDKRKKTIEVINSLNHGFFDSFLLKYNGLNNEMEKIEEKLQRNDSMKKFNETEKKLRDINFEIEKISDDIIKAEEEMENIDLNAVVKEIEKGIKDVLRVEVEII